MSQTLLDQIFIQWLIEKKGAYYNEQGDLCVAGEVFTADNYNKMIAESPAQQLFETGESSELSSSFPN